VFQEEQDIAFHGEERARIGWRREAERWGACRYIRAPFVLGRRVGWV
jgi:hypothetical protein